MISGGPRDIQDNQASWPLFITDLNTQVQCILASFNHFQPRMSPHPHPFFSRGFQCLLRWLESLANGLQSALLQRAVGSCCRSWNGQQGAEHGRSVEGFRRMFDVFLLFLLSLILQDQDGASDRSIQLLLHCQTDEMIAASRSAI